MSLGCSFVAIKAVAHLPHCYSHALGRERITAHAQRKVQGGGFYRAAFWVFNLRQQICWRGFSACCYPLFILGVRQFGSEGSEWSSEIG